MILDKPLKPLIVMEVLRGAVKLVKGHNERRMITGKEDGVSSLNNIWYRDWGSCCKKRKEKKGVCFDELNGSIKFWTKIVILSRPPSIIL